MGSIPDNLFCHNNTVTFLLEADEGRAVFQGTPTLDFYNPIGTIHGGDAV